MHYVQIIVRIGQAQIFQILLPLQIMLVLQILLVVNIRVGSVVWAIYLGSKIRDAQDGQSKHHNRQGKRFHRIALLERLGFGTEKLESKRQAVKREKVCHISFGLSVICRAKKL
jgi:hypothetical protein